MNIEIIAERVVEKNDCWNNNHRVNDHRDGNHWDNDWRHNDRWAEAKACWRTPPRGWRASLARAHRLRLLPHLPTTTHTHSFTSVHQQSTIMHHTPLQAFIDRAPHTLTRTKTLVHTAATHEQNAQKQTPVVLDDAVALVPRVHAVLDAPGLAEDLQQILARRAVHVQAGDGALRLVLADVLLADEVHVLVLERLERLSAPQNKQLQHRHSLQTKLKKAHFI